MKKVLFVCEKWPDGNPNLGLTNNMHNLIGSFVEYNKHQSFVVFLDECFYSGKHIDSILLDIVKEKSIDIIIFSFLGDSHMNPSVKKCYELSNFCNLIFMWPDTAYSFAINKIMELKDFTHISWGGEDVNLPIKNHKFLFCPEDPKLYYDDKKDKFVSFIGSLNHYFERNFYLSYLKEHNFDIFISGGQRENKLSAEEYARYIRTSEINLNFPESPSGKDQFKGRCLETIASNSMLLSRESEVTKKYLIEGQEFISFSSKKDLLDKLNYFKNNKKEAEQIALNGYNKYVKSYSNVVFWDEVLREC